MNFLLLPPFLIFFSLETVSSIFLSPLLAPIFIFIMFISRVMFFFSSLLFFFQFIFTNIFIKRNDAYSPFHNESEYMLLFVNRLFNLPYSLKNVQSISRAGFPLFFYFPDFEFLLISKVVKVGNNWLKKVIQHRTVEARSKMVIHREVAGC